jgi:hypothetical protein
MRLIDGSGRSGVELQDLAFQAPSHGAQCWHSLANLS